jgi:hypothetical protein
MLGTEKQTRKIIEKKSSPFQAAFTGGEKFL